MTALIFWLVVFGMTLVALAFLLVPLRRSRVLRQVSRREANIALYRERLRELEQSESFDQGLSSSASADAKAELDARLIDDVGQKPDEIEASKPTPQKWLGLVLFALLPALAVGTYLNNSDWQLALAGRSPEAVTLLLQRLERHLQSEPTDAAGWQLLAQSRMKMQRFDSAVEAYARVNALEPTADTLLGEAEARALAAGGNLGGRPTKLIEQALRMEPESIRAQWYAGMVAWQIGDKNIALDRWMRVAGRDLPADFRSVLEAQIRAAGGNPPSAPTAFEIRVEVSLDPALADRVTDEMTLFVYARAAEQGGPPLAVARHQVSDLPLSVVLDDSLSMLPDRKLSSVDRWTITARIARQGSAESRSGDLYAEQLVNRQQLTDAVKLSIDRAVP